MTGSGDGRLGRLLSNVDAAWLKQILHKEARCSFVRESSTGSCEIGLNCPPVLTRVGSYLSLPKPTERTTLVECFR
jgi:hypothetical protein